MLFPAPRGASRPRLPPRNGLMVQLLGSATDWANAGLAPKTDNETAAMVQKIRGQTRKRIQPPESSADTHETVCQLDGSPCNLAAGLTIAIDDQLRRPVLRPMHVTAPDG